MKRHLNRGIERYINAAQPVKPHTISQQPTKADAYEPQDMFSHDGDRPRVDYRKDLSKEFLKP